MIRINIAEAKTHLSRYLAAAERGERVLLCRRNVPIAELRPLSRPPASRRPVGMDAGVFRVPPDFFEPLPAELIEAFEGVG